MGMKKLMAELLKYIRDNYPANYGDVQIKIDGRQFFIVIERDDEEREAGIFTMRMFINEHYPRGNDLNLKNDFYFFTNFTTVKRIKKELWIDYLNVEDKNDFVIYLNGEDEDEILIVEKELLVGNDVIAAI